MKKSVLVMAGLLAMALAGSAQAAPMFAVQDASNNDKFTVDAAGMVNAEGQDLALGGKMGITLSNAPGSVALTAPQGALHVASTGNLLPTASTIFQHTAGPTAPGSGVYSRAVAPNMSFFRINRNDVSPFEYVSLQPDNSLGYFNFGTIDPNADPTGLSNRKSLAMLASRAEGTWSAVGAATPNTPTYFAFLNSHWTGSANSLTEKMRLTSIGRLEVLSGVRIGGIGATNSAFTKPACDATTRGTIFNILGSGATADQLVICTFEGGTTYDWRAITLGAVIP